MKSEKIGVRKMELKVWKSETGEGKVEGIGPKSIENLEDYC